MLYNPYQGVLSEKEFYEFSDRINKLSKLIIPELRSLNYQEANNDEYIGLSYTKKDNTFFHNIGFELLREIKGHYFRFYNLKTFDSNGFRYGLSNDIENHVHLEAIEKDWETFVNRAIAQYELWTIDDLLKSGNRTKLMF